MAKVTAFLHTYNDAPRIARALESLRACDEILVIDHGSADDTPDIAEHHGATVLKAVPGVNDGVYVVDAHHDWIFCLQPTEAVGEALEASLFEWKERIDHGDDKELAAQSFSVGIREETPEGWKNHAAQTRLVNRTQINWPDAIPPDRPDSIALSGDLLRFYKP